MTTQVGLALGGSEGNRVGAWVMDAWGVWWAHVLALGPVGLVALVAGLQLAGVFRVIPWWARTLLSIHVLVVLNNLWVISRLAG